MALKGYHYVARYPKKLSEEQRRIALEFSYNQLDLCKKHEFPECEARCAYDLGIGAAEMEEWEESEKLLTRAGTIYEHIAVAEPVLYLPFLTEIYLYQSRVFSSRGKDSDARIAVDKAIYAHRIEGILASMVSQPISDDLRTQSLAEIEQHVARIINDRMLLGARDISIGGTKNYYSCFVSYSHHDSAFVDQLVRHLRNEGVDCWYAPEDIKIGARIQPTLRRAIYRYEKLLLVLSQNSVESEWVEEEFTTARGRERTEKVDILFPICIDDSVEYVKSEWAAYIREARHIADLTRWREEEGVYLKAIKRLLRDLSRDNSTEEHGRP
jgi:hypothetical protein